jgi:hypothetical protein
MNNTGSEKAPSPKEPEKIGLIKRFLNWIARGAEEGHMSGTSCPS